MVKGLKFQTLGGFRYILTYTSRGALLDKTLGVTWMVLKSDADAKNSEGDLDDGAFLYPWMGSVQSFSRSHFSPLGA